ncbi:MAG TPA: hypothetical protein VII94_00120 [Candidatus Saccharimonadales bacterium]
MKKYLSLLLGFFILMIGVNRAFAASSLTNGITVSPAIEQIILAKGQTTDNFKVEIINNTNSQQFITASVQDFTYLNENGAVSFFGSSTDKNDTHGLVNFIDIGLPEIAIASHQSQVVPVSVVNADKLTNGGHYAAVVFKAYPLSGKKTNFSIIQAVSSLVFLSTSGEGTQNISLDNALMGSIDVNLPQQITTIMGNSGNTQTTPRGYIQILSPQGKLVSQSQINIASALILPQSKELIVNALNPTHKFLWPGFYTFKIFYNHDGQTKYMLYQKRILLITEPFLIMIIVIVIALIGWPVYKNYK